MTIIDSRKESDLVDDSAVSDSDMLDDSDKLDDSDTMKKKKADGE